MRAALDHQALVQDDDLVTVADRGEAVRDDVEKLLSCVVTHLQLVQAKKA